LDKTQVNTLRYKINSDVTQTRITIIFHKMYKSSFVSCYKDHLAVQYNTTEYLQQALTKTSLA